MKSLSFHLFPPLSTPLSNLSSCVLQLHEAILKKVLTLPCFFSPRLSTGFSILTSDKSMILQVNKKCLIASAGFDGDRSQLHKVLTFRSENYEHFHKKPMSCPAMAQMLGNTLYYKRFFPYYTFNLCAGIVFLSFKFFSFLVIALLTQQINLFLLKVWTRRGEEQCTLTMLLGHTSAWATPARALARTSCSPCSITS